MKVKELKEALQDIAQVLEVAGTKTIQKDFQGVLKLLDGAEEQDLEPFLQDLESKLVAVLQQTKVTKFPKVDTKLVNEYANRLIAAKMDEEDYTAIAAELQNNPKIRKAELTEIANLYHARPANSVAKLHQSIRTRFYERIYDRDATEMARKATPW